MPFNAHAMFRVVQDVDAYATFIRLMTHSEVDNSTRHEETSNGVTRGSFTAATGIGF
jgi:coenzyme Q-binding protein COQ10